MRYSEYRPPKKKRPYVKFLVMSIILLVLALSIYLGIDYLKNHYNVSLAVVEGNVHYTDDEIRKIVMDGKYADNSLYLAYKYKNKEIKDIPFVETINVQIVSNDTIRINVYEKALAGYIEYLGRYVYFDKDGIVVESSTVSTPGVPEVVGVTFDYVILYEKLPAKDEDLFKKVLNVTQLMTKYGVDAQKMYFAENGDITLYKDDIVIRLGKDTNLDIKIMNLPSILENLDGKNGILHMENYDEGTVRISFETN